MGAGTIVGALIGFRWRPRLPMRTGMLLALPWPVASRCFALGLPGGAARRGLVAAGTGITLFGIWWETALAERMPPHVLSRVTAYDWMGSLALLPIGYVLAGPLGEALGRRRGAARRRRARARGAGERAARAGRARLARVAIAMPPGVIVTSSSTSRLARVPRRTVAVQVRVRPVASVPELVQVVAPSVVDDREERVARGRRYRNICVQLRRRAASTLGGAGARSRVRPDCRKSRSRGRP